MTQSRTLYATATAIQRLYDYIPFKLLIQSSKEKKNIITAFSIHLPLVAVGKCVKRLYDPKRYSGLDGLADWILARDENLF